MTSITSASTFLAGRAETATLTLDGRRLKFTNLNKVYYPREGYTKRDVIQYYDGVAPLLLPYLKARPLSLRRYPDGIAGKSFYQKDAPAFAPSWIRTAQIWSEDSQREISYFVLESAEAIAYMANLGAIPIHIWSSRMSHLDGDATDPKVMDALKKRLDEVSKEFSSGGNVDSTWASCDSCAATSRRAT